MTELIDIFDHYLRQAAFDEPIFWAYPIGVVTSCWVLFLAISWGKFRPKKIGVTDEYQLYSNMVVAASIVTFVFIGFCCYAWSMGLYSQEPLELSHILSLILGMVILLGAWVKWQKLFSKKTLKNLIPQSLTRGIEHRRIQEAKRNFQATKWWILLPALGFLMLWIVQNRSYNLVSFVVDNSPTMSEAMNSGDVPLEIGRDALSETISELDEYTDVIISTFQSGEYKQSVNEIVQLSNTHQLLGVNVLYDGDNKEDAIAYIENDLEVADGQSPICETIWKNFLFAQEKAETKTYDNALLIVVTDGQENNVDVQEFLCEQSDFNDFYTPENVYLINLDDSGSNSFFQKAEDCGYTVEDGSDMESYIGSLESILSDFTGNWFFIIWLVILYTLFSFFAFLVNPQQIR